MAETVKRRKFDYPTRELAEAAARSRDAELTATLQCLKAVLYKQIYWVGSRNAGYRVGVVNPTGAMGGYILQDYKPNKDQQPMIHCEALDKWCERVFKDSGCSNTKEMCALVYFAAKARQYRNQVLKETS